jgi:hypothetical protein
MTTSLGIASVDLIQYLFRSPDLTITHLGVRRA